ncbi:hypothetical protein HMI49_03355 [Corallococcus exercitus]|uniref:PD-(D/E)XK endonuclease-like domain-containing protein n=1 Tax=Corallococcus exercitus TaxID=2316736 RepID=A0A7Y4NQV2_9BACT|nr:hypothetical protein [Corallococcus exercitus]
MPPVAEDSKQQSIEGGVLHSLSVSQLRTFVLCERAWFFAKDLRLPVRPLKARDLGNAVHAQIDHYLRKGEEVLGPLAAAGKHLRPALRKSSAFRTASTLASASRARPPCKGGHEQLPRRTYREACSPVIIATGSRMLLC